MPLSTIFQLNRGDNFYRWRKPEYPEKTTDLPKVTDKLQSSALLKQIIKKSQKALKKNKQSGLLFQIKL